MQPIHGSSNVTAANYDKDTSILTVEFRTGATYEYGVSPQTAAAFFRSESKGSFVHRILKNYGGKPVASKTSSPHKRR
jgi:hypothetical protein